MTAQIYSKEGRQIDVVTNQNPVFEGSWLSVSCWRNSVAGPVLRGRRKRRRATTLN